MNIQILPFSLTSRDFYGPDVGRRHDITLCRQSGLNESYGQHMSNDDNQSCIYADTKFMLQPKVKVGYDTQIASASEQAFKSAINVVKSTVELS